MAALFGVNFKSRVKHVFAWSLYASGLLPLFAHIRLRRKALALMYHRVLTAGEMRRCFAQDGISVDTETFEKQIRYLSKYFKPVSFAQFIDHMEENKPFPPGTCLITFDDGWRDNFLHAYPILKKNNVPALIFLTTDFIGSFRRFWQDELADLLAAAHKYYKENSEILNLDQIPVDTNDFLALIKCGETRLAQQIEAFIRKQKKKDLRSTKTLITALKKVLPPASKPNERRSVFLNWEEVKIMAEDGISFGSHGKSHALLPNVDAQMAEKEIRESKRIMQECIGSTICAFSYPNGDYNSEIVRAVRDAGYRAAFGTKPGYVSSRSNPFKIRRINIHQDMTGSVPMFLARISGIL